MNQKLRTARSGLLILFAVLCIVCLSLSLALSAHFAAYAEGEEITSLITNDGWGHNLWRVHYLDSKGVEHVEDLWNGIDSNNQAITYIDRLSAGSLDLGVCYGKSDEKNYYAPYRGTELTIKLNPDYQINGTPLSELYDLSANAQYTDNSDIGNAKRSSDMRTSVVVSAEGQPTLKLQKNWKIATLCNMVNVADDYISDYVYADASVSCELVQPAHGNVVIYHFSSAGGKNYNPIAVVNGGISYYQAGKDGDTYFLPENESARSEWPSEEVIAAASEGNLINYTLHRLDALVTDTERNGAYTLTIASLPFVGEDGIHYAATSVERHFNVSPEKLGDDEGSTFESKFKYEFLSNTNVEYTGDYSWIPEIKLMLGNTVLQLDKDYTVTASSSDVGSVDLRIVGKGNLEGYHTISGRVRISPAKNDWKKDATPSIISWMYGTYNPANNLIVGRPEFLDNVSDIKFRISKLDNDGNVDAIATAGLPEALSDIRYYVDPTTGETDWHVTAAVSEALKVLEVGKYRLFASVYGANIGSISLDRNYLPIDETSVDFEIFKGTNSWKAGAEPTILGWTVGKLENAEDRFNAEAVHGTTLLMIYDMEDHLIYSNMEDHANSEVGDINVLKSLKAGRYYLSAEVIGTENYTGLKATVLFDVVPNNLPLWAVILIVAGSLGIVAVVFSILHQKGILQMLTGKVIIAMRTRANVDATLAAIRASKVAREAEISVAAAKARDAEEAAKSEEASKSDK